MRGFTPYLLLGFIVWVAIHNQLAAFMKLATTINWNIAPPAILADSASATGASAISSVLGSSGGGGGIMGDVVKALPIIGSL